MSDIWTMVWKESKDLLLQGRWAQFARPVLMIVIAGILLPLQFKREWLSLGPVVLPLMLYIPLLNIVSIVGDAIAGERERHTLETLLASRMPDYAIVLGKVIVTVGYTWGITIISLLLSSVVLSLFGGLGGWVFYTPFDRFVDAVVLTLLASILAASAGVLISQRVATVRQAQQTLAVATVVLVFGGFFALRSLPAGTLASLNYPQILLIAMVALAILDAILLGLALVSFQRSRLILS